MCEEGARLLEAAAYGAARSGPPMLATPDGRLVPQGGQEDRATWWTCSRCGFRGPHVGTDRFGRRACLGLVCDGVDPNPGVPRVAGSTVLADALDALVRRSEKKEAT